MVHIFDSKSGLAVLDTTLVGGIRSSQSEAQCVRYGVVVHMRENSVKYGHNFSTITKHKPFTLRRAPRFHGQRFACVERRGRGTRVARSGAVAARGLRA